MGSKKSDGSLFNLPAITLLPTPKFRGTGGLVKGLGPFSGF